MGRASHRVSQVEPESQSTPPPVAPIVGRPGAVVRKPAAQASVRPEVSRAADVGPPPLGVDPIAAAIETMVTAAEARAPRWVRHRFRWNQRASRRPASRCAETGSSASQPLDVVGQWRARHTALRDRGPLPSDNRLQRLLACRDRSRAGGGRRHDPADDLHPSDSRNGIRP